jgi:hypothetical protein
MLEYSLLLNALIRKRLIITRSARSIWTGDTEPSQGKGSFAQMMEIEMKTVITALALALPSVGPTFVASSHASHLQEGRASAYAPQAGGYYEGSGYSPSSREEMIHAN